MLDYLSLRTQTVAGVMVVGILWLIAKIGPALGGLVGTIGHWLGQTYLVPLWGLISLWSVIVLFAGKALLSSRQRALPQMPATSPSLAPPKPAALGQMTDLQWRILLVLGEAKVAYFLSGLAKRAEANEHRVEQELATLIRWQYVREIDDIMRGTSYALGPAGREVLVKENVV